MSYFAHRIELPGFAFSLQRHINRVSKFKTRCTSSKLCSYIFLSCLYSVLPICLPLPHAPVLSLHHQPAKPDSQAAYQAFCQPGCLIVLSKHPPAFRLPPPPQKKKKTPRAGLLGPPPTVVSLLSPRPHAFGLPIFFNVFFFFAHSMFNLFVFPFGPTDSQKFSFPSDRWPFENISHPVAHYCTLAASILNCLCPNTQT